MVCPPASTYGRPGPTFASCRRHEHRYNGPRVRSSVMGAGGCPASGVASFFHIRTLVSFHALRPLSRIREFRAAVGSLFPFIALQNVSPLAPYPFRLVRSISTLIFLIPHVLCQFPSLPTPTNHAPCPILPPLSPFWTCQDVVVVLLSATSSEHSVEGARAGEGAEFAG